MAVREAGDVVLELKSESAVERPPREVPAFAKPLEGYAEGTGRGDETDSRLESIRKGRAERAAAEAQGTPERDKEGKFRKAAAPPAEDVTVEDDSTEDDDAPEGVEVGAPVENENDDAEAEKPAAEAAAATPPAALTEAEKRFATALHRLDAQADEVKRRREEYERDYAPRVKQLEEAGDKVAADPIGSFVDFIAASLGISREEAEAERDTAFTDWAGQQLGTVKGSGNSKAPSQSATSRKIRQELARHKQETRSAAEKRQAEEADREFRTQVDAGKAALASLLDEATYPLLHAFADKAPQDLVWDVIVEAQDKGQNLTPAQAAQLANDYYKPRAEKLRSHLLGTGSATPAKGSATQPPAGEATKKPAATTPSKKSPRTLTDATASVTPARSDETKPVIYESDEDERRASIRKHRPR
jgi:hypothetical protein